MSDTIKWQDMSKEELFMMAKWHESRAEAFKEVIYALTQESPENVQREILYGPTHGEMVWEAKKGV